MHNRKGNEVWVPLIEYLRAKGHVYDRFLVKCEQYVKKKTMISAPETVDNSKKGEYAARLKELQKEFEHENRTVKDYADEQERQNALAQKRTDLSELGKPAQKMTQRTAEEVNANLSPSSMPPGSNTESGSQSSHSTLYKQMTPKNSHPIKHEDVSTDPGEKDNGDFRDAKKKRKKRKKALLDISLLTAPESYMKERGLELFHRPALLTSWSNARDVKKLAKRMFNKLVKAAVPPIENLTLTEEIVIETMASLFNRRSQRNKAVGTTRNSFRIPSPPVTLPQTQDHPTPNPPMADVKTSALPEATKKEPPKCLEEGKTREKTKGTTPSTMRRPLNMIPPVTLTSPRRKNL
ncbi:hypothetical protein B0J11DRAFT_574360 [Dendryphion nanum]|uniref:Uncharacterized protein n=1 Tax=Dendryphion nanum TaxID=256645 RepID=A0A9P9EK91_9PLEO|nr:hypothetical protein B0J11DRAFT_574360 [Dendryphion nanum]